MSRRWGPDARADMNGIGDHNDGVRHALEGVYEVRFSVQKGCSDHVIEQLRSPPSAKERVSQMLLSTKVCVSTAVLQYFCAFQS